MKRSEFTAVVGASLAAGALESCSGGGAPAALPTPPPPLSYDASIEAIRALIARDAADATLERAALPRLYEHGHPTDNAVLLFHGFTNCPQQFDLLAQQFAARGCNVYVPRIPRHGLKDRLTTTLADLTIRELGECVLESYANARIVPRSVAVPGLSRPPQVAECQHTTLRTYRPTASPDGRHALSPVA